MLVAGVGTKDPGMPRHAQPQSTVATEGVHGEGQRAWSQLMLRQMVPEPQESPLYTPARRVGSAQTLTA